MAPALTFTGERYLPACAGEIAYEHWHRYAFARHYAAGKRVLDAACGEGYGTALLGTTAAEAAGVDIDPQAIAHAQATYGGARVRFVEGSCTRLPLPDALFDVVVSFETIEHLEASDQPRMLAEFARVLKPGGLLVISSPNKRLYSDEIGFVNEFHRHELYRGDLSALLTPAFPAQRWFHQRVVPWSAIWSESGAEGAGARIEAWVGDVGQVLPYAPGEGMYFIVVAAREPAALPPALVQGSLFTDAEETERKRAQANASEVLRQDALLRERDAALAWQAAHVQHLEALVAAHEMVIAAKDDQLAVLDAVRREREQLIALRDRELAGRDRAIAAGEAQVDSLQREHRRQSDAMKASAAALAAERDGLQRELAAHEGTLAERQGLRWWLALSWRRLGLWFRRR